MYFYRNEKRKLKKIVMPIRSLEDPLMIYLFTIVCTNVLTNAYAREHGATFVQLFETIEKIQGMKELANETTETIYDDQCVTVYYFTRIVAVNQLT